MRYAIPTKANGTTLLTQPVDIPDPLPNWAADAGEFLAKMFQDLDGWVQVADDNVSGAVIQQDGSYKNPAAALPTSNTPNNPYFGKKPMPTQEFWPFIQLALGADRMKRLVNDSHFIGIDRAMQTISVVDPDDKGGQFLKLLGYLTATNGDDASPLLKTGERDSIMTAWK